jgi:hypothetical protein
MALRFYVIDKTTSKRRVFDGFHYAMFHGGEVEPLRRIEPGVAPAAPLRLWKNVHRIAPLFQPELRWVVSDDVKTALAGLPHIDFLGVQFTRLFDYPYRAKDFSHWDGRQTWYEIEPIIEDAPHDPSLVDRIGRFWEVLVPRHMDVHKKYKDLKRFHFDIPRQEDVDVDLSAKMLENYPILWDGPHILSEAAYSRVEPFIDWDYFLRWEGEVT